MVPSKSLTMGYSHVRQGISDRLCGLRSQFKSEVLMRRLLMTIALMSCIIHATVQAQEPQTNATGHYLFAWTGDAAHTTHDFHEVIDADPARSSYGQSE